MGAIDHIRYFADTLAPTVEGFRSPRSNWLPYALFAAVMLFSVTLHLLRLEIAALAIGFFAVSGALLELSFRTSLLRLLLPIGQSQNVLARIGPSGPAHRKVAVIGHLDTHRTPVVFSTNGWLRFYRILIPLGLVASLALLLLFAASIIEPASLWRSFSVSLAGVLLIILVICVQAELTPFTRGANDNASGAGVVLSLAERLASEPLSQTEVWTVLTGCEEVGCHGAEAFARRHAAELGDAAWLTIDSVGGANTELIYISKETFLLTTKSDPELLSIADAVATQEPDLNARTRSFVGAYTESVMGAKHGMRVLTIIATGPDGLIPEWHRPTDVTDRIDQGALDRCETFVWEMLQRIDRGS
jgi:hypothetical protein